MDSDHVYKILDDNKINIFEEGVLKPYTNKVWTTICQQLDNRVNPKTLYISVFQDRHSYQSKFKKALNILTPTIDSIENSENSEHTTDSDENGEFNEGENKNKQFDLSIPYEKYLEFEPMAVSYKRGNKFRTHNVLKQNTWADIINDALLDKYKLPCNFIYKRSKVLTKVVVHISLSFMLHVKIKAVSYLDGLKNNLNQDNLYFLVF